MCPVIEQNSKDDSQITKLGKSLGLSVSFFDINQLELAIIHHALEGNPDAPAKFSHVEIGETKRILELQRDNLIRQIKSKGGEIDPKSLKKELDLILGGKKVLGPKCFAPIKEKQKDDKKGEKEGKS